jgi:hypothetical protein
MSNEFSSSGNILPKEIVETTNIGSVSRQLFVCNGINSLIQDSLLNSGV